MLTCEFVSHPKAEELQESRGVDGRILGGRVVHGGGELGGGETGGEEMGMVAAYKGRVWLRSTKEMKG